MLEANIRAMLDHSPRHVQDFTEALERIPHQDVALMAYTAGRTARRLGVTDMANPYRGTDQAGVWQRWFTDGGTGAPPPPPLVPRQVHTATRGMSQEERRAALRDQFGIALPPDDGKGGRSFMQMAKDFAARRR